MKNASMFDGRPCPPEFKEALERLRKDGLLDSPEFKQAAIRAAQKVRQAMRPDWEAAKGPPRPHRP